MNGRRILDERSDPPVRSVVGRLLASCEYADLAIGRIRLAALDLTEAEVRGPTQCRVLLGQLHASTLHEAAPGGPARRPAVRRLTEWLASDRLEVRSAGIGAWTPDFSVYVPGAGSHHGGGSHNSDGGQHGDGRQERLGGNAGDGSAVSLLGAHYFGSPQLTVGPSVTVILREPDAIRLLRERFQELWEGAHDVAPAIMEVLGRGS